MPRHINHVTKSDAKAELVSGSLDGPRGDTVKLRKSPKASRTNRRSKGRRGQGNDLGYGNNREDSAMGHPQPSPQQSTVGCTDAVHRLDGSGLCPLAPQG